MYIKHPTLKIAYFDGDNRAILINEFMKDYDLYDYRDAVEDEESAIEILSNDIKTGNTEYLKLFFKDVIKEMKLNITETISSLFSMRLIEEGFRVILYEYEEEKMMRDRAMELLNSLSV